MFKKEILSFALLLVTSFAGLAQAKSVDLPEGTEFTLVVSERVRSSDAQLNQKVMAEVKENVRIDGRVIIARGTKVEGHVTSLVGVNSDFLTVEFDKVEAVNGEMFPIKSSVGLRPSGFNRMNFGLNKGRRKKMVVIFEGREVPATVLKS